MSQLEPPTGEGAEDTADDQRVISLDGTDRAVTIPEDATDAEAAAISAAVSTHLGDRERAAAAAAAAADEVEPVDQWRFASKLRSLGKRRYPRSVAPGDEWKAAGRSYPR